jgi:lysine 2,3-aminomutase
MEVTPEMRDAAARLLSTGWIVTNQLVFTTAASRRGHTAKLRKALNNVGVMPYYNFVLKGYHENTFNYAPVARAVQEEQEEKVIGRVPERFQDAIRQLAEEDGEALVSKIGTIRAAASLPFLATDRTVLNLPAVGKSLTFRTIGITRYGRRILEFDHDRTRAHSPIIDQIGKIIVIESKSISEYLEQLDSLGENVAEYDCIYGYSLGQTEPRVPIYDYPPYEFEVTDEITNLELEDLRATGPSPATSTSFTG